MSTRTRRSGEAKSKRQWPAKALALFALIVIGVYALVFFTGTKSATPKLGIDLQGGTRVTLVPQGEEPTSEQLQDARRILENRVNGMGVSGASVVVDGNTIVIEAAGDDTSEIRNIGQTSQLFFRPVLDPPAANPAEADKAILDMANEWVKYGIFTPEEGQSLLKQFAARKEQAEKQAEEQAKAAESGDANNPEVGKDVAPSEEEAPAEPKNVPQISAEPLPEPNGPVEAAERRQETTEMLRKTRQSTDPTQQYAALTLMSARCFGQATDPLAGSDKQDLPLVACDPSTGQAMLLDEVPR